ncbi:MAG: thrombospondin type 3 repeat-containing protein, partial [Deltaproteobacteria bacterium]|nr:thrombospondin type 3 repeat-containing protein [Deltaproteobacteria bacterium]
MKKALALALALAFVFVLFFGPRAMAISGGQEVGDPDPYPYVGLFIRDNSPMWTYRGQCTGILIGPHTVLTARHCVWGHPNYLEGKYGWDNRRMVRFGFGRNLAEARRNSVEVNFRVRFLRPKVFESGPLDSRCSQNRMPDLAVVALRHEAGEDPYPFDSFAEPPSFQLGDLFIAVGFGPDEVGGGPIGIKRFIELQIDGSNSSEFWSNRIGREGVEPGDSGGPALLDVGTAEPPPLIGIASGSDGVDTWGNVCSAACWEWVAWNKEYIEEDIDDDGHNGYEDNCPFTSNPLQEDSDGDGIGNECDNCERTPNPFQENIDEDDIGDACDSDIDGVIPDMYDVFPGNEFIGKDYDGDGICDEEASNPIDCWNTCAVLDTCYRRLSQEESQYCKAMCLGSAPLDNCVDLNDPNCSWPPSLECKRRYYNPDQADEDDDGTGDQCETKPVISQLQAAKIDSSSLEVQGNAFQSCAYHGFVLTFRMQGGNEQEPEKLRPLTIGVCGCPAGTWSDAFCNHYCPPSRGYPDYDLSDYAWDAISAQDCAGMTSWPGLWSTGEFCADKDAAFSHDRGENYVEAWWFWPDHVDTTISPPNYTFSGDLDLRGKSVRFRVQYPLTNRDQYPHHDDIDGYYKRSEDTFDAAEMQYDEAALGCIWIKDPPPQQVCPIRIIPWGPQSWWYRGVDPYLTVKPSAFMFGRDTVSGNVWMFTHTTSHLIPTGLSKVTLPTPAAAAPMFDSAEMTAAEIDTSRLGLGEGPEAVMFSYSGTTPNGAAPSLHFGLIERPGNMWVSYAELFGPEHAGNVPGFGNVRLIHDPKGEKLVMIGDLYQSPEVIPNSVVVLDLKLGGFEKRGSLARLFGLQSYSVALDEAHRRVVIFGGEIVGAGHSKKVSFYDLKWGRITELADLAPPDVARSSAGVAVDAEGMHLYVYGGRRGKELLSDGWSVNLMSGEWTFLGDGALEGPGALERPAVLLDQMGKRLWVTPRNPVPAPFEVKFWALNTRTGTWQEHVTLAAPTEEPGVHEGQIRDGRWKQLTYESPDTIPYPGRPMLVTLTAEQPVLSVQISDGLGQLIAQDRGGDATCLAGFISQPGETYTVRVGPGPGYASGAPVRFRVKVAEADMVQVGQYSRTSGVRDVEILENIAVLAGRRALETVDLSDPQSPALMDRKKFAKAALEVALRGSRAVVARSRLNKGMRVADISETGQITLVDSAFSNGLGRAVAIWQNHVYVAAGWAGV